MKLLRYSWRLAQRYLLLVALVLLASLALRSVAKLYELKSSHQQLAHVNAQLARDADPLRQQAVARLVAAHGAAPPVIEQRLQDCQARLDSAQAALAALERQGAGRHVSAGLGGLQFDLDGVRREAELRLQQTVLEQELAAWQALRAHGLRLADHSRWTAERHAALQQAGQAHVAAHAEYQAAAKRLQAFRADRNKGLGEGRLVYPWAWAEYLPLKKALDAAVARNQAAHRDWLQATAALQALVLPQAPTAALPEELQGPAQQFVGQIGDRVDAELRANWLGRALDALQRVVSANLAGAALVAAAVLAGLLLLKLLAFYGLARWLARWPTPALAPLASGQLALHQAASDAGNSPAAAHTAWVPPGQQFVVHPEFIAMAPQQAAKSTRLGLGPGSRLASWAAGLDMMTVFEHNEPMAVTLKQTASSAPVDFAAIRIPHGDALVLRPRYLVAYLQAPDQPLRISSHWQLARPTAWFTRQLRQFVVHGPALVWVQGHRGALLEPVDSRSVLDPALVMGYSAHLATSVQRSETFWAYLTGRQPLLKQGLAGPTDGRPGWLLRQGAAPGANATDSAGRALNGAGDALLRLLGI